MKIRNLLALLCCSLLSGRSQAQNTQARNTWLERWQDHTSKVQAAQPSWPVPVISAYPMLIQVFRTDVTRQVTPALTPTWNYGAARGLNIVPGFNSEFDFYPPPYIQHNVSNARDGFGDTGLLYKYRILSRPEKRGNYMLSAQVVGTIATGTYSNGSRSAVVSPTLLAGKGFGSLIVISTLGGTLPTSETATLGRTVGWNTTAEYRVGKFFTPEIEDNATYIHGSKNDGKMQNFLAPGFTVGKFKLHPRDPKARTAFAAGAGMQIATSGFHTYNHNLIFTGRILF